MDDALAMLEGRIQRLEQRNPTSAKLRALTKRLNAIQRLMEVDVPRDPLSSVYRIGNTLGPAHRHWRRAKLFQQYRLFYRADSASKVIIFVWVNDDESLRAYGSTSDAYLVFQKMLDSGYPPHSWADQLEQTRAAGQA